MASSKPAWATNSKTPSQTKAPDSAFDKRMLKILDTFHIKRYMSDVVAYICNPSTQEAEAGGSIIRGLEETQKIHDQKLGVQLSDSVFLQKVLGWISKTPSPNERKDI